MSLMKDLRKIASLPMTETLPAFQQGHKVKYVKFPKKFWIVESPGEDSEIGEVFYELDMEGFFLQARGGLNWSKVHGFYTKESDARKEAEKLMSSR